MYFLLPVAHPAETHTAGVSGAVALCDAAKCSRGVCGDGGPHGPRPGCSARLWSNLLLQSETLSYRDSAAAAEHPAMLYRLGSPAAREGANE